MKCLTKLQKLQNCKIFLKDFCLFSFPFMKYENRNGKDGFLGRNEFRGIKAKFSGTTCCEYNGIHSFQTFLVLE